MWYELSNEVITSHFVFPGAKAVGMNPKVNNMIQGYGAAKYGLIMISDSGMRSEYYFHYGE